MDEITDIERQENRELANSVGFGENGFEIRSLAQITLVAQTMMNSGLVPSQFNSTAKIIVVAQAAKELGKGLWWGLNNMFVVNGKVGIAASAVAGLILQSGVLVEWKVTEVEGHSEDDFGILVQSKRKGFESGCQTMFTIEDAKKAGLWTGATWKKYPKIMLTWRAITFHARLYYSDVLGGAYTEEELSDLTPALAAPKCDTPPRDQRRKKLETIVMTGDGCKISGTESPGTVRGERAEHAVFMDEPEPAAEPDTDGVTEDNGSAVTAYVSYDEVVKIYTEVVKIYTDFGGTNFVEFAAEVLMRDEDEVSKPEQFTDEMLAQLKRHLIEKGV